MPNGGYLCLRGRTGAPRASISQCATLPKYHPHNKSRESSQGRLGPASNISGKEPAFQKSPVFVTVLLLLFAGNALAAQVTPSERVTGQVNVREDPSSDSPVVGQLRPGEKVDLLASIPRWYKVLLPGQIEGFVSKSWTTVVAEGEQEVVFQVHFLDVGTGDSAILDMGDREIVIDGGDSTSILHDYVSERDIIQDPIELLVVTHADTDHWRGLVRLLGFDGRASQPYGVQEFWEPGYDRDCRPLASYNEFLEGVRGIPGIQSRRPLEGAHASAVGAGQAAAFALASLPGVRFTVLHTDATPDAVNNDCAYLINNTSIVLMIEVSGFRMLFTGDANGKERDEPGPGTPGHVERKLLDLEALHPGTLKADLLKVPHHGSETANTQNFIDAVDPSIVII